MKPSRPSDVSLRHPLENKRLLIELLYTLLATKEEGRALMRTNERDCGVDYDPPFIAFHGSDSLHQSNSVESQFPETTIPAHSEK
ncbi:hypothetical protein QQF64_019164 [Cirrhinus molitorella]|uniref:Uncharacterized protein n=1 Tax=Cirrhinus molitorella TaxID=172907 RepID=A0ABR3LEP1_9TELE